MSKIYPGALSVFSMFLLTGLLLLPVYASAGDMLDPLGKLFRELSPYDSFDLLLKQIGEKEAQGLLPGVTKEISDFPYILDPAEGDQLRYLRLLWWGADLLDTGVTPFADLEVTMLLGDRGVCIKYSFIYERMDEEKEKGECQ